MALSFSRLMPRALFGVSAAVLVALGGASAPAFAAPPAHSSSGGSSSAHQSGPPADAASAQKESTAAGSPPSDSNGNRGHVQIEGAPDCGAAPCGNDNDPHIGCTLTVQLFGYRAGTNRAGVVIAGQPPSGRGIVLTDSFSFTVNGSPQGNTLEKQQSYSITPSQLAGAGLTPQKNQGYHLRVDVSVNGKHAKSKVVWYGCSAPAGALGRALVAPDTNSAASSSSSATAETPDTPGLVTASATAAARVRATADTPAVSHTAARDSAAVETAAVTAKPSHSRSGFLAFTGWELAMALSFAAAALAGGFAMTRLSHRRRQLTPAG